MAPLLSSTIHALLLDAILLVLAGSPSCQAHHQSGARGAVNNISSIARPPVGRETSMAAAGWPLVRVTRGETQAAGKKARKKSKRWLAKCLKEHNKLRRRHGAPDLIWDENLAQFAAKRSRKIAASDGKKFGHPPDLVYGENLFWHSSTGIGCAKMVAGWYDEINQYDFEAAKFSPATGHFTQLVWRSTRRLGCARATSSAKRGGAYLTCNYEPAGNVLGEFQENVSRPSGGQSPRKQKKKKKKRKKKKKKKTS